MRDNTTADWARILQSYRAGDVWAVWADDERIVQMCRRDGKNAHGETLWATPLGHMREVDMRRRGWIKADGSEAA